MNDKIIVYSSFYNPIEASIIKAKLEDSEIACFLTDEHTATLQPLYSQANGGVNLHVFERDVDRINLLLADENILNVEVEETNSDIICPNCGVNNVGVLQSTPKKSNLWAMIFTALFYPFIANKSNKCFNCEHEFK